MRHPSCARNQNMLRMSTFGGNVVAIIGSRGRYTAFTAIRATWVLVSTCVQSPAYTRLTRTATYPRKYCFGNHRSWCGYALGYIPIGCAVFPTRTADKCHRPTPVGQQTLQTFGDRIDVDILALSSLSI